MQFLYGSGEADAITRQGWAALVEFVERRIARSEPDSVVLAQGASLAAPRFETCGGKPKAAVFDVDETVLLNLGFEYDDLTGPDNRPFDPRWEAWEAAKKPAVIPTPGAREALARLRALNVAVVFNTNRKDVPGAVRAIEASGVGPADHLDTLFVQGDDDRKDLKDARRWRIAGKYCVIALGGDQLGDFSDLFNDPTEPPVDPAERRERTDLPGIASLWGHGWFVFPNSAYGKALRGAPNDLFPPDKRWVYPGEARP